MRWDLLRHWRKWKRKLEVMVTDKSIVMLLSTAVFSMSCRGSWEKQGYSHCCCETTFLFVCFLSPSASHSWNPTALSKAPQNKAKGQIWNYKKKGKRSESPVFLPRIQENVPLHPFRQHLFCSTVLEILREKRNLDCLENTIALEFILSGEQQCWEVWGETAWTAWTVSWVFKHKLRAGRGEDEFGQVTLKLAWLRLQAACRRELLHCSQDTSAESLSLK